MTDIWTRLERVHELSVRLLEMCNESDMKRFFELDRKFQDFVMLNKLEDEINNDTAI
jgi:hypothetical protein